MYMCEKTLVFGKIFQVFGLQRQAEKIKKNMRLYVIESKDPSNLPEKIDQYKNIVLIDFDLSLNPSYAGLVERIYTKSSKDASIVWWTREPFWDLHKELDTYFFGRRTYFLNAYTGLVYQSVFSQYFGVGGIACGKRHYELALPERDFLKSRFDKGREKERLVCAYASCFHDRRLDMADSLVEMRNAVVKRFWERGICDVYGKNWNGRWDLDVTEETRAGLGEKSWGEIKVEQSREKYSFSLCVENSLIKNYVTEKISHAIESYLIPIYVFGNGLEDWVPTEYCFSLDPHGLNCEHIERAIQNMEFDEYYERVLGLTLAYNNVIGDRRRIDEERIKPARSLLSVLTED